MPNAYTGPRARAEQWLDEFFDKLLAGDVGKASMAFRRIILLMIRNFMTPGDLDMGEEEIRFLATQVGLNYETVQRNATRVLERARKGYVD